MKIQTFLKRQAQLYPKRSFEARIVIGVLFFSLNLAVTIGDLIVRFVKKLITTFFRTLARIRHILTRLWRVSQRMFRFIFPPQQKGSHASRLKRTAGKSHLRSRPRSPFQKKFTITFVHKLKYALFGTVLSLLFIFLPLLFLIFIQDLPSPQELSLRPIPQTTKIFDRNGVLLSELYASQNRTLVTLKDIPLHLQQATVAIEDKNFYKHPGFDLASIIRALRENFIEGRRIQGGSTITQQLIKSSMLTSEKSIYRKVKELALAFWAERIYTKQQILEMYFNQVPYGGTAWGIEAATEVYFDKHVSKLTLSESAFLAGITAAPTTYSPYGEHPTLWKNRQKDVLTRMVDLGYITKKQAAQAEKQELRFHKPQLAIHAPHFVAYVKDVLVQKYGLAMVEKGGLQVVTSLDLKTQQEAERIVKEEVAKAAYLNLTNGAAVITDPKNGDILAMVGSRDYNDPNGGNVNIATSHRQPGSTVKVITYSAALTKGFTAATVLDDTPSSFPSPNAPPYLPVNYDGRYYGRVPVRFALANSLNLPAVKVLNQIGVQTMVHLGQDMGITSWDSSADYGLAVTLGGAEVTMLDMATVNGTLANEGIRVDINPIRKITDFRNNSIEEKKETAGYRVLNRGIAFIVTDILSDNIARASAFGPSSLLAIPGHKVAVKTGTSDNKRDNWAVGYTKDVVTVVWVGNNDNSPMSQTLASGITGATPIWHRIMSHILTNREDKVPVVPENVVAKTCNGRKEYFIRGTENSFRCNQQLQQENRLRNQQQLPTRTQQNQINFTR